MRRLSAGAILTVAALFPPLTGQATDGVQVLQDPRYGSCKYVGGGLASNQSLDRLIQICAKVTIYLDDRRIHLQSRHLVNFAAANLPSGSYEFTLTKLAAGVTTPLMDDTYTFSSGVYGGLSVERLSGLISGLQTDPNIKYTATTKLTVGSHTEISVHQCAFPAQALSPTRGDWLGYCLGVWPVNR